MEQAKAAEAEIARGDYRGPLHGIPWGRERFVEYKGYSHDVGGYAV